MVSLLNIFSLNASRTSANSGRRSLGAQPSARKDTLGWNSSSEWSFPWSFGSFPSVQNYEYSCYGGGCCNNYYGFNFAWSPLPFYKSQNINLGPTAVWHNMGLDIKPSTKSVGAYDPNKSIRYPINYAKYGRNGDYIKKLTPVMQDKVMALLDYAEKEGIKGVKIISGYRTYQDQMRLYKKYAGTPGRAAKPGNSSHESGRAIDINASQLKYSDVCKLGRYAKEVLHMRWGGDFRKCREIWHFDISPAQANAGGSGTRLLSSTAQASAGSVNSSVSAKKRSASQMFVNKNATPHVLQKNEYDKAMNGDLTYPVIKVGNVTYYKVNSANGVNKQAKEAFNRMKAAAVKEGINLNIVSGYRTHAEQIRLFKKYYNSNKGCHSIEKTARFSAIPGYSEHESGCAFDINTADSSAHFENSSAYKWLVKNASKYGFELSYPKNNKEGLIFEPWHWRYVG